MHSVLKPKCINCGIEIALYDTLIIKRVYCNICGIIFDFFADEHFWIMYDGQRLAGEVVAPAHTIDVKKLVDIIKEKTHNGNKFIKLHEFLPKIRNFNFAGIFNINLGGE